MPNGLLLYIYRRKTISERINLNVNGPNTFCRSRRCLFRFKRGSGAGFKGTWFLERKFRSVADFRLTEDRDVVILEELGLLLQFCKNAKVNYVRNHQFRNSSMARSIRVSHSWCLCAERNLRAGVDKKSRCLIVSIRVVTVGLILKIVKDTVFSYLVEFCWVILQPHWYAAFLPV